MANDPAYYFQQLLLGIEGLTDLVASRVYVGDLPKKDREGAALLPAVTVFMDPEEGQRAVADALPSQEASVVVQCWAKTEAKAKELYSAIADALTATGASQQTVQGEVLLGIGQSKCDMAMYDPESTRWIYSSDWGFAMFQC